MPRMLTLGANISGEDLGRAADHVDDAIKAVGNPRRRNRRRPRPGPGHDTNYCRPSTGLGVAIAAVFLLLLAGNFQSFRLAFAVVLTIPPSSPAWSSPSPHPHHAQHPVLHGHHHGRRRRRRQRHPADHLRRASRVDGTACEKPPSRRLRRLRPILMTTSHMIAGMIPIAIGLGEGGQQAAPLGRAVIGGLIGATLATLLVLPALFSILQRDTTRATASLDPTTPQPLLSATRRDRRGSRSRRDCPCPSEVTREHQITSYPPALIFLSLTLPAPSGSSPGYLPCFRPHRQNRRRPRLFGSFRVHGSLRQGRRLSPASLRRHRRSRQTRPGPGRHR